MKKWLVGAMLVLGLGFFSAEKAEAQLRGGGRYCRPAPLYPDSGLWFRQLNAPRCSYPVGYTSVSYTRYSQGGYSYNGGWGGGGRLRSSVYTAPTVVLVPPPVRVVDWDEESLIQLGREKFKALSNEWDKDGENFAVTIREQDFQTTKGVRVIEDVDYIATWTVTRKTKEGKEEVIQRREKFTIKFDDYGEFKKFKDD